MTGVYRKVSFDKQIESLLGLFIESNHLRCCNTSKRNYYTMKIDSVYVENTESGAVLLSLIFPNFPASLFVGLEDYLGLEIVKGDIEMTQSGAVHMSVELTKDDVWTILNQRKFILIDQFEFSF